MAKGDCYIPFCQHHHTSKNLYYRMPMEVSQCRTLGTAAPCKMSAAASHITPSTWYQDITTVKLVALYPLVVLPCFVGRTAVIIPMTVQQGFSMPFLKDCLDSHPSPLPSPTTYQALGPGLRCGKSTCALLSSKHVAAHTAAFPHPPANLGSHFWICQIGGISALFDPSMLQLTLLSFICHSIPRHR